MTKLIKTKLINWRIDPLDEDFFNTDSIAFKLWTATLKSFLHIEDMDIIRLVTKYIETYSSSKSDVHKKNIQILENDLNPRLDRLLTKTCYLSTFSDYKIYCKEYKSYLSWKIQNKYNFINRDETRSDLIYQYKASTEDFKVRKGDLVVQGISCYGGTDPIKLFQLMLSLTNGITNIDSVFFIFYVDNCQLKKDYEYVQEVKDAPFIGIPVIVHSRSSRYFDILQENNHLVKTNKNIRFYKEYSELFSKYRTEDNKYIVLVPNNKQPTKLDFIIKPKDTINTIKQIQKILKFECSILFANQRYGVSFGRNLMMNYCYNKFKHSYIYMMSDDDDLHIPDILFSNDTSKEIPSNEIITKFFHESNDEFCAKFDANKYAIPLSKYINSEIPYLGKYCNNFSEPNVNFYALIFGYKNLINRCYLHEFIQRLGEDQMFLELMNREYEIGDFCIYGYFAPSGSSNVCIDNKAHRYDCFHIAQSANYYLKTGINKQEYDKSTSVTVHVIEADKEFLYTTWSTNGILKSLQ